MALVPVGTAGIGDMRNPTRSVECSTGSSLDVLHGWKEIAKYVGIGVRTAQRWETWGLPVHRPIMGIRANVIALRYEIRSWLQAAPVDLAEEVIRLTTRIAQLESELNALRSTRNG